MSFTVETYRKGWHDELTPGPSAIPFVCPKDRGPAIAAQHRLPIDVAGGSAPIDMAQKVKGIKELLTAEKAAAWLAAEEEREDGKMGPG